MMNTRVCERKALATGSGWSASALSDIVVTVAVINILGIKMGTAGIAALLMLIGYSIDTDIMLTTKVLKRKDTSIHKAVRKAFKTGMTMTLTTIAAVTVAYSLHNPK